MPALLPATPRGLAIARGGGQARVPPRPPRAADPRREWSPPDEGGVLPPGESTWELRSPIEAPPVHPPEWQDPEPAPAPRPVPTETGPEPSPLGPRPDDDPPWFPPPEEVDTEPDEATPREAE
jgi:hypothetical protein